MLFVIYLIDCEEKEESHKTNGKLTTCKICFLLLNYKNHKKACSLSFILNIYNKKKTVKFSIMETSFLFFFNIDGFWPLNHWDLGRKDEIKEKASEKIGRWRWGRGNLYSLPHWERYDNKVCWGYVLPETKQGKCVCVFQFCFLKSFISIFICIFWLEGRWLWLNR